MRQEISQQDTSSTVMREFLHIPQRPTQTPQIPPPKATKARCWLFQPVRGIYTDGGLAPVPGK